MAYTYGRTIFGGDIDATLSGNTVRRGDFNKINGNVLAEVSGNEIWRNTSQIGYVKNGYVYSYGGTLLAKINSSNVDSVQHGKVFIDGASASDAGKAALWFALTQAR